METKQAPDPEKIARNLRLLEDSQRKYRAETIVFREAVALFAAAVAIGPAMLFLPLLLKPGDQLDARVFVAVIGLVVSVWCAVRSHEVVRCDTNGLRRILAGFMAALSVCTAVVYFAVMVLIHVVA